MTCSDIKAVLVRTYADVPQKHTLQMAAALSYYFVLSLFPALILLSAAITYLPIPGLFNQILSLMGDCLPADAMSLVREVLADIITPNRGALLSFGILGTLWTVSGGFAATIEALDIASGIAEDRPFWQTRPLAVALALMTGALFLIALCVMIVGPNFGEWLAGKVHLSALFVLSWPYIHWAIAIIFAVLAVEILYLFAPKAKQRFLTIVPGSAFAVGCWIVLSHLLAIYFRHFGGFNKTYGTLGAAIVLMVWLYWTGFGLLVGAELNAELAKQRASGKLKLNQGVRHETVADHFAIDRADDTRLRPSDELGAR